MDWIIWKNKWWKSELSAARASALQSRATKKAIYKYNLALNKLIAECKQPWGIGSRLESMHGEKLPFLKKNVYKKLQKKSGPEMSKKIREDKKGYWDWKKNLFYDSQDLGHPRKLWKKEKDSDNFLSGSTFYSKNDRDLFVNWWKKRKKFRDILKYSGPIGDNIFLSDYGWQDRGDRRKDKALFSLISYKKKFESTKIFKRKRSKQNSKKQFNAGAENRGFWKINWWNRNLSSVVVHEWDYKSFSTVKVVYSNYKNLEAPSKKKKPALIPW